MVTSTLVGMTISLAIPAVVAGPRAGRLDSFTIGLNTAANGLGMFLVAPFVPRLLRRFGVVGCMRGALVMAAACMLAFPLWVEPWFWFASHRVQHGGRA